MSAGTILGALAQLVILGAVGWGVGNLILARCSDAPEERGTAERALAAVGGAIAFSVAAMLLHIVTGGAVFGVPGVVPVLGALCLYATRSHLTIGPVPWGRVFVAALVLLALYQLPALEGGSSLRTGDPPWHLGWTEQLLAGDPVPTGPAPEFGRNAYPWGLHAVMATAVRLVPGSTPVVALEMLHLLLIAALPLAAACLARRVRPDAGWAAAVACSLIGGFGWISAKGADFVTSPSQARHGADLVVASPNSVYELFPPGLPRELGLVMLGIAGWLIAESLTSERRNRWAAAGASVGLVGVLSVPLFVSGLLWMTLGVLAVPKGRRLAWFATAAVSALAVFALWAGPVASNAVTHGGFVNITPQLGVEWPLPVALASWGLLLPLAAIGFALAWRSPRARLVAGFVVASGGLLLLAVLRGRMDWALAGNATLLHQGRMWPPAHLLGAALAGVALVWLFGVLSRRHRALGSGAIALVLLVGAASPVLASRGLADIIERGAGGFVYADDDLAPGSFLRRTAAYFGPSDIVEVQGNDELGFLLFQLSGTKLATFDDPRLVGNELRIRYADLAAAYDRTMASGGFEADYMILPAPDGAYSRALVRGSFDGRDWILIQLST
ncbi:MAG TPA: hypothetical protein VJ927_02725 [Actinomycetota bacterium]|nr:hypothetical protein [Actinomycetota bacterium]